MHNRIIEDEVAVNGIRNITDHAGSTTLIYMLNIIREKLKPILSDKLNIDGLTISQNNDYGQEVKHFHIHVIPRYKNDKFPLASDCSKVEDVYHKLVG